VEAGIRGKTAESALGTPTPALRPFVRRYIGYRFLGFAPGTHLGLPSPHLTVVISLAEPTRVALRPGQQSIGYAALASGLTTAPAFIAHDGDQYGVQLELTPLGARSLLGVPASGLAGSVADLSDLLGAATAELPDRMAACNGWPQRFAVLDEVLRRRVDRLAAPVPTLTHVWRRVLGSGGAVRVADLADEVGWSRRHLSAQFAGEFGATPKDVARIVRFHRSKCMLQDGGRTVAEVAAAAGYYDQPHLAREWRDLAGVPPSVWLASEELR
jgi:AraC-like DNA-binding protein